MHSSDVIAIEAKNINKSVSTPKGTIDILHDISFHVLEGETIAIVGSSGSGKTTLLSLLAGLDLPTSGEVSLFGQSLHDLDEERRALIRRDLVSFVFQTFQLIPELDVLENVIIPMEIKGINRTEAKDAAIKVLTQVGLEHRLHHFPKTLSGGEQQRVALARAFVTNPKILFADEPTGSLDSENGEKVIELLFDLNKHHRCTLVLVTHDLQLANRCQRVISLRAGKLINSSKI